MWNFRLYYEETNHFVGKSELRPLSVTTVSPCGYQVVCGPVWTYVILQTMTPLLLLSLPPSLSFPPYLPPYLFPRL